MQELTNSTLTCLNPKQLHPALREHIAGIAALAEIGQMMDWDVEAMANYTVKHGHVIAACSWLFNREVVPGVFDIPYYSEEFCDQLLLELHDKDFARNAMEDSEYQIEELVLGQELPELYETCEALFAVAMQPVLALLFMQGESVLTSIQAAKYNPEEVSHGNWHFDQDSDHTVVVSLNPESFTGGGTELRTGPFTVQYVPPLPKGHALLFMGRTTLHRGLYVEQGDRMLLVHWTVAGGHKEYNETEH